MAAEDVDRASGGSRVAVITDTATGVPEGHGIYVAPMGVVLPDGSVIDSGSDRAMDAVRQAIEAGESLSTVPPSMEGVVDAINRALADGFGEFVMVTTSSGLSLSYDVACSVSAALAEETTEVALEAIDSLEVAASAGMSVLSARTLLDAGIPVSELGVRMDAVAARMRMWMVVGDPEMLVSHGILGRFAAFRGTLLGSIPVMSCDENGRCAVERRTHGREDALAKVSALVSGFASDFSAIRLSICHAPDAGDVDRLEELLRDACEGRGVAIEAVDRQGLAPEVVAHVGLEAVGVAVRGTRL